ncbi:MAG: hypothetical protein BRD48_01900 [Bacteroidetes bacterium QS_9_68_14]|nr:MAG: hypothetical protein BRD48_01900 [Bacteroidetes bacterium QS_9_68_14]
MEPSDPAAPASAEAAWHACQDIIRDNVSRQSYKTWFEPLEAMSLDEEGGLRRLTVKLPSRFYYEWLEEHYFGLLRKTVTKVLGDNGRLFYEVVIEKPKGGHEEHEGSEGASMRLPARPSPAQTPASPTLRVAPSGRCVPAAPAAGRAKRAPRRRRPHETLRSSRALRSKALRSSRARKAATCRSRIPSPSPACRRQT